MWKDNKGKEVSKKEFIERWKGGIDKVTAMQKIKVQIIFSIIVLLGVSIGMVTAIITGTWWLLIIMVGAFGLNIISLLGILQQYITFSKIEKIISDKGGENGL